MRRFSSAHILPLDKQATFVYISRIMPTPEQSPTEQERRYSSPIEGEYAEEKSSIVDQVRERLQALATEGTIVMVGEVARQGFWKDNGRVPGVSTEHVGFSIAPTNPVTAWTEQWTREKVSQTAEELNRFFQEHVLPVFYRGEESLPPRRVRDADPDEKQPALYLNLPVVEFRDPLGSIETSAVTTKTATATVNNPSVIHLLQLALEHVDIPSGSMSMSKHEEDRQVIQIHRDIKVVLYPSLEGAEENRKLWPRELPLASIGTHPEWASRKPNES
jgi:hypothetical protein